MSGGKKIVFVGFLSGFGGAEKSMVMIANGLAKLGHEITIISLKNNKVVYEIDNKVKYIFIPDREGKKIKNISFRVWDLKNKLKEIKPSLVISFWLQPAIFSVILSKYIGFKTIYSERGDPTDKEYNGILGGLRNICFKFIDGFVFQTEGAKKCFSKQIQNRSTVINNPVYIKYNDYVIPNKRRNVIVNVGRLHKQKNQKLLINAFAKISNLFPEYKLEIYGNGELKDELEIQIEELGLDKKIVLKGTTNKLFDEIVDANLFVLSSDYEGMPNALMEAMALGVPCISTDCSPGGARELIKHGNNGLITSRNSVDELAQAMEFVIENPKDGEKFGSRAKEICNTHSVENILKMWDVFIRRKIDG